MALMIMLLCCRLNSKMHHHTRLRRTFLIKIFLSQNERKLINLFDVYNFSIVSFFISVEKELLFFC